MSLRSCRLLQADDVIFFSLTDHEATVTLLSWSATLRPQQEQQADESEEAAFKWKHESHLKTSQSAPGLNHWSGQPGSGAVQLGECVFSRTKIWSRAETVEEKHHFKQVTI